MITRGEKGGNLLIQGEIGLLYNDLVFLKFLEAIQ